VQEGDKIFQLPFAIDVYNGKTKTRHQVWVQNKTENFTFKYTKRPDLINVDASKVLLCEKKDSKTLDNFIHQYQNAGNYLDRKEAIDFCAENQTEAKAVELLKLALKDKYDGLRKYALEKVDVKNTSAIKTMEPMIAELAKADAKSTVRAEALTFLAKLEKAEYKTLFAKGVNDSSYSIAAASLGGLVSLDNATGIAELKRLSRQPIKGKLAEIVTEGLLEIGTEEEFDVIVGALNKMPVSSEKLGFLQPLGKYLAKINNTEKVKKGVDIIVGVREAIPAAYAAQITPFINNMVLKTLMNQKKRGVAETPALQEQVNYIEDKLKK
jgi:aminopeptidase N